MLALGVVSVYWPVHRYDFVNYDDVDYVVENAHVRAGLTLDGVKWAFTTGHAGNWHPLTWLSHMTDVQLFGMNAGAHHAVNVFFHVANALLLFLLLCHRSYILLLRISCQHTLFTGQKQGKLLFFHDSYNCFLPQTNPIALVIYPSYVPLT